MNVVIKLFWMPAAIMEETITTTRATARVMRRYAGTAMADIAAEKLRIRQEMVAAAKAADEAAEAADLASQATAEATPA